MKNFITLDKAGVHAVAEVWLDPAAALFPESTPSIKVILGAYPAVPTHVDDFDPQEFAPLSHVTLGGRRTYRISWKTTWRVETDNTKNLFALPACALAVAELGLMNPVITHTSASRAEFICLDGDNDFHVISRICSAYDSIRYKGDHRFAVPTVEQLRALARQVSDRTVIRNLLEMTMDHGLYRYTDKQKATYRAALEG